MNARNTLRQLNFSCPMSNRMISTWRRWPYSIVVTCARVPREGPGMWKRLHSVKLFSVCQWQRFYFLQNWRCNGISKDKLQDVWNLFVVIPLSNCSPCSVLVNFALVSLDEISQQGVFLHGPMDLLARQTGSFWLILAFWLPSAPPKMPKCRGLL